MIFDELSNASFLFVPRRLGSELDEGGGVKTPPPLSADTGSFGAPDRHELMPGMSLEVLVIEG